MPQLSYWLSLVAASLPLTVSAQIVEDYNPPRAACCVASTAQALANGTQDWNALGRYHADNEKLKAQPSDPGRVVFL